MKIKIVHLTSVHPRYDTRIFFKECIALKNMIDCEFSLIVADNLGNEVKDGINILDVGKVNGRINRFINTTKNILNKALEIDGDIYHFHDPELIPIGLKLKKKGKKVIFDIHENIALQILDKDYIPNFLRKIISNLYRKYEVMNLNKFDALVLAEHSYSNYYEKLNKNIEIILNMPDIEPLKEFISEERNKNEIFYIGGISNNRGYDVTIDALKILKEKIPDIFMHYIGPYSEKLINPNEINRLDKNLKLYGRIPLYIGLRYSKHAVVGLSVLKPIGNYTKSYSTKIFEYMALGLPVITSNFELYKNVIEKYNCGICINPLDSNELSDAIEYIIKHPEIAKEMGSNGRRIVAEKFNWSIEKEKLKELYLKILKF